MKKIKELQKRSTLGEGRNFGIGFSILNKIGNKFETYLPFTACRDYLNDFIFVEKFKTEIGNAHGYNHQVLDCFKNKRFFYMGVNTLHYNHDGDWSLKEEATNILINNYKNLESFLNQIEDVLNIKTKTTIELDEDTLILKVPIYWSKSTPLISIYTLLIRCYFNISDNFVITEENLNAHKPFIDADKYFMKICGKFFRNIKNVNFEKINYEAYNVVHTKTYKVHNFGIQTFLEKVI
jgi:hypothetical protein